jgi:hypothetical protein
VKWRSTGPGGDAVKGRIGGVQAPLPLRCVASLLHVNPGQYAAGHMASASQDHSQRRKRLTVAECCKDAVAV